ncbi:MAG: sigma-E factor negative regulatory protein [Granulosicoccaceae bacterium]|jgi:sigma-E factor negative regulatory protein RseA
MKDEYAEQVSGLVDGELDERSASKLVEQLRDDNQARRRWASYHLISDTLRGNLPEQIDSGFARRVSRALEAEPVVLAPRRRKMPAFVRQAAGFAVAATVAVVAVLTVQQQAGVDSGVTQVAATTSTAPQDVEWVRVNNVKWNVQQPAVESKLNAYLVNHNGYTNSVRGILPYAPIVSSSTPMPDESSSRKDITGDEQQR